MKQAIIALLSMVLCCCLSCSKNNIVTETGTIDGAPAITLYGSSRAPADYLFISTHEKKISYNGLILPYVYTTGNAIVLINAGYSVARCTLDTLSVKTTLTVDSTYGQTFGSVLYTAK